MRTDEILFLLGLIVVMTLSDFQPVRPNDDKTEKTDEPIGGREHNLDDDESCWCHPDLFFDGGEEFADVWVHKGPGEYLPPPNILAFAVYMVLAEDLQTKGDEQ